MRLSAARPLSMPHPARFRFGLPRSGILAMVAVMLLVGCQEFSGSGRRPTAETMAALSSPEAETALRRLRGTFQRLRPSGEPVVGNDPHVTLFADILNRVLSDYVRPVSPVTLIDAASDALVKSAETQKPENDRTLMEAGIAGMLTQLDPYSSYLNPDNYRNMQAQTHGEFGGLGIEVTLDPKTGWIKVVVPIDGTPAAQAGLRAGDLISHVDGTPIKGMPLIQAVFRMRGPTGTRVRLTLVRGEGAAPQEVNLTRSTVRLHPVQIKIDQDVAILRITTFNERTEPELEDAVARVRQSLGRKMTGVVVDLRNNPGGLLDQAIAVADAFLEARDIVSVRGRKDGENRRYQAHGSDLLAGIPMVVLINGGSASASEIVAAALQDHHRALLFGTRSYGKGSVQTVSPLADDGALRLTTARYYRPAGTSVDCVGVHPDLNLPSPQPEGRTEEPHQDPAACGGGGQSAAAPCPRLSGAGTLPGGGKRQGRRGSAAALRRVCTAQPARHRSLALSLWRQGGTGGLAACGTKW